MRRSLMILLFAAGAGQAAQPNEACGACHRSQTEPYRQSSMSKALFRAEDSPVLQANPDLQFTSGPYRYRIERRGNQSMYRVTDGETTLETPLLWAFGNNTLGQTYVYEWQGNLYQSRVSFYRETGQLDHTLGAQSRKPSNLGEAAGLKMGPDEQQQCYGCHSNGSTVAGRFSPEHMVPGVTCERCHGDAGSHLATLLGKAPGPPVKMASLKAKSAEETSNFCGQCHRTWADIASSPGLGVGNVRFQPYRLTNSKCFDVDDSRIACTACHNPHEPLHKPEVTPAAAVAFYDGRCQACHGGGKPEARACKAGNTASCTSCHMPKVELPGAHHRFTDHQIRIARADAKYPE